MKKMYFAKDKMSSNIVANFYEYDYANNVSLNVYCIEVIRYLDNGEMKRSYKFTANMVYGEDHDNFLTVCDDFMPKWETPCNWFSERFGAMRRLWAVMNKKRPAA